MRHVTSSEDASSGPTHLLVLAAVVLAPVIGACGGNSDPPAAQPTPNATTFEPGRFDNLPMFPRSEPLGPRTEKDGTVARSYLAKGTTPEDVLEFYWRSLDGNWHMLNPIERIGVGTFRADWGSDDYKLRVSATDAPTLELDDASKNVTVQYSLTLTPL